LADEFFGSDEDGDVQPRPSCESKGAESSGEEKPKPRAPIRTAPALVSAKAAPPVIPADIAAMLEQMQSAIAAAQIPGDSEAPGGEEVKHSKRGKRGKEKKSKREKKQQRREDSESDG
jgi:hypothetical protein